MSSRGATMVELIVGIAVAAVISLVSASLFRAGTKVYTHTMRQNAVLADASKALDGQGSTVGMLWATRRSMRVSALNGGSLVLLSTGSVTTTFSLAGGKLWDTTGSVTTKLADNVTDLGVNYYTVDGATGLVSESSSAVSASFVTVGLTMSGYNVAQTTYSFFSGARLRNF